MSQNQTMLTLHTACRRHAQTSSVDNLTGSGKYFSGSWSIRFDISSQLQVAELSSGNAQNFFTVHSMSDSDDMEIKEAERIILAKPVASRPTCSTFTSFSELLAGAINASPPKASSETTVAAIRPKTVRIKSAINHMPVDFASTQAETSRAIPCRSLDTVLEPNDKSTVVYKPLAKLVSKKTVSLLANLGNFSSQLESPCVQATVQHQFKEKHVSSYQKPNLRQDAPAEEDHQAEPSKLASQSLEDDQRSLPQAANVDRPSYDGYNWRKYGQKQVKGSEYPRSYYKCTHPNCPVKKKVERSLDGQIAEIVYKGEHNHQKPQPPKRNLPGIQAVGLASDGAGQDVSNPSLWNEHLNERNEGNESRMDNQNEVGVSAHTGKAPLSYDRVTNTAQNAGIPDNSCGVSGDCEDGSKGIDAEDYEPKSKRRRSEIQPNEPSAPAEGVQEPRIVVQSTTDSEIVGDGFRWRKYGQKVVKGNPYPRSYYRCTSLKCNVRKHVERASDDPKSFITTYEGKHNHEMPTKTTNQTVPEQDYTSKEK